MQLDNVIQEGVFVGSADQIQCIEQAARDANFEGYTSVEQYLETIESAHNEESAEFDRGPIDSMAFGHLSIAILHAWKRAH
jgi:hypothetical protein